MTSLLYGSCFIICLLSYICYALGIIQDSDADRRTVVIPPLDSPILNEYKDGGYEDSSIVDDARQGKVDSTNVDSRNNEENISDVNSSRKNERRDVNGNSSTKSINSSSTGSYSSGNGAENSSNSDHESSSNNNSSNSINSGASGDDSSNNSSGSNRFNSGKNIYNGVSWRDVVGVIAIAIGCAVAVTVGVGGGGLFVPIMILIMGFSPHEATAISQSLMTSGTLAVLIINVRYNVLYRRKQGEKGKGGEEAIPPLDIYLVLLLGPIQISGTLIGVLVNHSLSSFCIGILMVMVLIYTAYMTIAKGRQIGSVQSHQNNYDHSTTNNKNSLIPNSLSAPFLNSTNADSLVSAPPSCPTSPGNNGKAAIMPYEPYGIPFNTSSPSLQNSVGSLAEEEILDKCAIGEGNSHIRSGDCYGVVVVFQHNNSNRSSYSSSSDSSSSSSSDCLAIHNNKHSQRDIRLRSIDAAATGEGSVEVISVEHKKDCFHENNIKCKPRSGPRDRWKWLMVIIIWGCNIALLFVRGGKYHPGLVPYCSSGYWGISAAAFAALILCSIVTAAITNTTQSATNNSIYKGTEVLVPNIPSAAMLLLQTFLAGVIAGIIGIGGGMLLGPLLLHKGLHPVIATAVNSTLVLITSSSAAISFIVNGQAPIEYSLILGFICFVAALMGKCVLDTHVIRYSLYSTLVFILAGVIIASLAAMLVSCGIDIFQHGLTGFRPIC